MVIFVPEAETEYGFNGYCLPGLCPVNKLYSAESHGQVAVIPFKVNVEHDDKSWFGQAPS